MDKEKKDSFTMLFPLETISSCSFSNSQPFRLWTASSPRPDSHPRVSVRTRFPQESPVGIAAGFDKNALLDARQITVRWFKPDGYWRLEIVVFEGSTAWGWSFEMLWVLFCEHVSWSSDCKSIGSSTCQAFS